MVVPSPHENDKRTFDPDLWDAAATRRFVNVAAPVFRRYFRAEVRGMERVPTGSGVLLVSNHSGGMITPDVMLVGSAFYERFGYQDRPLYALAHLAIFALPFAAGLERIGAVHASRANAVAALKSGAAVLVFPGGDYDCYRPSTADHVVDFNGRCGYVKTALEANVPIVPVVSIGAQQSHLFITRGAKLAKSLGLDRARLGIIPLTFGFPFGFTLLGPPNIPLPTKIVTHVLDPIDPVAMFGDHSDISAIDVRVRAVMQAELDSMARARRFPVLG